MMLALPDRRFLVALDPILFHHRDPRRHRLWFEMVRRPPSAPAALIRREFGARYVLCPGDPRWVPFLRALGRDPDARLLARTGPWFLFEVAPAAGGLLDGRER